jgi:hypothetical protein
MVIGGIAASLQGQARVTEDVDAAILLEERSLDRFLEVAVAQGLKPRIPDAVAFARRSAVLLLEHAATRVGVDLTISRLPFEREAIARARSIVAGGLRFKIARPEDLVIMKAVAHRPQDLQDIRAIIAANPGLKVARVRARVKEFASAVDMPELWEDIAGYFAKNQKTRRVTAKKNRRNSR